MIGASSSSSSNGLVVNGTTTTTTTSETMAEQVVELRPRQQQQQKKSHSKSVVLKRQTPLLSDSTYRLWQTNSTKGYRICFFVNGDRHFHGLNYVVNLDRIKTLDLLCAELSRILVSVKSLPAGVRFIFDVEDGALLRSVQSLRDGQQYVCSSTVHFVRLDYANQMMMRSNDAVELACTATHSGYNRLHAQQPRVGTPSNNRFLTTTTMSNTVARSTVPSTKHISSNGSSLTLSTNGTLSLHSTNSSSFGIARSKIVALLHGSCRAPPSLRPSRRTFRLLLNHRIAQNYEQLLNEISNCVQLHTGAVHRVYGLSSAKKINSLEDFLDNECIYLVYGRTEKCSLVDFMLDESEKREISSIIKPAYQFPSNLVKYCLTNSRTKLSKSVHIASSRVADKENHYNTNTKRTPHKRLLLESVNKKHNNEKELKAFSLPRNFMGGYRSVHPKLPEDFFMSDSKQNVNQNGKHLLSPPKPKRTSANHSEKLVRLNINKTTNEVINEQSSPESPMHTMNNDGYPSGLYYDLKNSTSDHLISAMNTTETRYRSESTLPMELSNYNSNDLVFNYPEQYSTHYSGFKSTDDMSSNGRRPSVSSSSTPGAASSVSCSEDFSYASVDASNSYQTTNHTYDALNNKADIDTFDDQNSSSSDTSTPSFSSLSCVVRYPGSLPPITTTNLNAPMVNDCSNNNEQHTLCAPPLPVEYELNNFEYDSYNAHTDSLDDDDLVDSSSHPFGGPPSGKLFVPKKEVSNVYCIDKVIGDGKFGVVYSCVHRTTGNVYALKVVNKSAMQEMMAKSSRKDGSLQESNENDSEAAILKRISHPNIVRIYDHFEFVDESYLVLEMFKGGDLFDAISKASKYTEPEAAEMMNDLMQALSYLHHHHIVHRDIKLENLMVAFVPINPGSALSINMDGTIPRRYRQMIKLADFGLAVDVHLGDKLYTVCGTPTYVAPEILLETGYSFPVDVWAAGVIAFILICGFPPFANNDNDQDMLFDQIISGKFDTNCWDEISLSGQNLIEAMLCVEPNHRLTASQVLKHPWIRSKGL